MKRKIYLDYAATTPVDRRVFHAMLPYFTKKFGNPSNPYAFGLKAKRALIEATREIVAALNCALDEFIFTGSATEADNLAILGVARANREWGNKIIVSAIEHKGIHAACNALKKEDFEIVELPVGKNGLVNPAELAKFLDDKTVLVSVTCADSETGTIQPIAEISEIIKAFRKKNPMPYLHTDASQAALCLDINVKKLGVDLLTLSGHKVYGPKGIGGLYVRRGIAIEPIIFGGGQQRGLRAGTENVPAIVGFGRAISLAQRYRKAESARVKKLRDRLEAGIFKTIPKVVLNGNKTRRLPNFLNVSFLDVEGEAILLYLDGKEIFVNTGSACNSESLEPSSVLMALGSPYEHVHGSIRFTLGRETTVSDINYVLRELPPIVAKLRRISPLSIKY
ncbi:MAG: aminotransferase class V-fold PLP-dependent enzyme [Minisyncoccia bacterium]|jgi:cysteine desulfurase